MSSTAFYESLPYIDTAPSASALASAKSLIESEASTAPDPTSTSEDHQQTLLLHRPLRPSQFATPAMLAEDERVLSKQPLRAIDTTRYLAIDRNILVPNPDSNDDDVSGQVATLEEAVRTSYSQATHLAIKSATLAALEDVNVGGGGGGGGSAGKNCWLLANYQVEAELGGLERELQGVRREIDLVNLGRREEQEAVAQEMLMLQRDWKAGVGKVLEVEAATEGLRREGDGLRRGGG